MTSAAEEEYRERLTALVDLGVDPCPSIRDFLNELRHLDMRSHRSGGLGRLSVTYPARHRTQSFKVTPELDALLTFLRPGDVAALNVRDGVAVQLQPVVIARSTLERSDPAPRHPRTRQREHELFWSESTHQTFRDTARIVSFLHSYLRERNFLEGAMPVLTLNPDISPNQPFGTEASDRSGLNLRATYPYSERLLYSLERVYQIGPNFRDKPPGRERSREFSMLSVGQALADYEEMMECGELLLRDLALAIQGTTRVDLLGEQVDLARPWKRLSTADVIAQHVGIDINSCFDLQELEAIIRGLSLTVPNSPFAASRGQILHGEVFDVLLKNMFYPQLRQPTFLTEFPYFFGGPGRATDSHGRFKMRAEGFVAGVETLETASVLTDPPRNPKVARGRSRRETQHRVAPGAGLAVLGHDRPGSARSECDRVRNRATVHARPQ